MCGQFAKMSTKHAVGISTSQDWDVVPIMENKYFAEKWLSTWSGERHANAAVSPRLSTGVVGKSSSVSEPRGLEGKWVDGFGQIRDMIAYTSNAAHGDVWKLQRTHQGKWISPLVIQRCISVMRDSRGGAPRQEETQERGGQIPEKFHG